LLRSSFYYKARAKSPDQVKEIAINNRHPAPGIIHHSGQGVQYASREYVEELKSHGFDISM
jgi:transposase InsO family protein